MVSHCAAELCLVCAVAVTAISGMCKMQALVDDA